MRIKAEFIKPGLWGLRRRDLQDVGRQAIARAGFFWHVNFKFLHFQIAAFERYGYRRRSRKWEAIKARQHPEAEGRPLVFGGESERLAMGSNIVNATAHDAAHYHADVIVSGPLLNFHANEMTTTTQDEQDSMQAIFADEFEAGLEERARLLGATSGQVSLWQSALGEAA